MGLFISALSKKVNFLAIILIVEMNKDKLNGE